MEKYNIILDNTRCDMDLIWQILELRKEKPEIFYDKIQKISLYFMFPYCIWSKSRTSRDFIPYENIESDLNRYQDNDCAIFFEFENVDIKPDGFHDRYSNLVLETAEDKEVYAVVYNRELANYIQDKYPDIKLVQSEIRRNVYIETPFEMNIIDLITYKSNKDKLQNKSAYILAANSFCKNSYRCSNMLSSNKLNFGIEKPVQCSERIRTFEKMKQNDLFISVEEIEKINSDGIENFLVKANSDDRFEILETYLYYLIKPEYIEEERLRLIKACFINR